MNKTSWFNVVSLTLGLAFLYIPMIILIIFSFNESKLVTVWAGFSTKWYAELMQNEAFLNAAWVTIKVAVFSSTIATVLGTMAAYVSTAIPFCKSTTIPIPTPARGTSFLSASLPSYPYPCPCVRDMNNMTAADPFLSQFPDATQT